MPSAGTVWTMWPRLVAGHEPKPKRSPGATPSAVQEHAEPDVDRPFLPVGSPTAAPASRARPWPVGPASDRPGPTSPSPVRPTRPSATRPGRGPVHRPAGPLQADRAGAREVRARAGRRRRPGPGRTHRPRRRPHGGDERPVQLLGHRLAERAVDRGRGDGGTARRSPGRGPTSGRRRTTSTSRCLRRPAARRARRRAARRQRRSGPHTGPGPRRSSSQARRSSRCPIQMPKSPLIHEPAKIAVQRPGRRRQRRRSS